MLPGEKKRAAWSLVFGTLIAATTWGWSYYRFVLLEQKHLRALIAQCEYVYAPAVDNFISKHLHTKIGDIINDQEFRKFQVDERQHIIERVLQADSDFGKLSKTDQGTVRANIYGRARLKIDESEVWAMAVPVCDPNQLAESDSAGSQDDIVEASGRTQAAPCDKAAFWFSLMPRRLLSVGRSVMPVPDA